MTKSIGTVFNIVIIGAGNLATHLAKAIKDAGHNIMQIYSRSNASAQALAQKIGVTSYTSDLHEIADNADIYIYAVTDKALSEVIKSIKTDAGLHVHTAGSVGIGAFKGERTNYGSLYPLQTFTKEKEVDFSNIPIFYETNSVDNDETLLLFGSSLSKSVHRISSKERKAIHLAAVFACNFATAMWNISEDILTEYDISPKVIFPLIEETLSKTELIGAYKAQTGPAVRMDYNVMNEHITMLNSKNELKQIYQNISEYIQNKHNKQ